MSIGLNVFSLRIKGFVSSHITPFVTEPPPFRHLLRSVGSPLVGDNTVTSLCNNRGIWTGGGLHETDPLSLHSVIK